MKFLTSQKKMLNGSVVRTNTYHRQIEIKVHIGYTTGQTASCKPIHLSKRRKLTLEQTSARVITTSANQRLNLKPNQKMNMNETSNKTATSSNVSISKEAHVCQQLSQEETDFETFTLSGIHRSNIKEAVILKEEMK